MALNGTPLDPSDDFVAYSPDADYNGSDSFTYRANDGTVDSTIASGLLGLRYTF